LDRAGLYKTFIKTTYSEQLRAAESVAAMLNCYLRVMCVSKKWVEKTQNLKTPLQRSSLFLQLYKFSSN